MTCVFRSGHVLKRLRCVALRGQLAGKRVHAWRQLLMARAIENQCYVLGVNRIGVDGNTVYHSGNSAVIDPMGERIWELEHERAVFTTTLKYGYLEEIRTRLPFQNDRDMFSVND